jgi:hypothetical protein
MIQLHELVEGHVLGVDPRLELLGHQADGHEEVGLAKPALRVDEERVVGRAR